MRAAVLGALLAVMPLAGCGSPARRTAFDPDDYARYERAGTATLVVEVPLVLTPLGSWRPETVTLRPATRYSREWFRRAVGGLESLDDPDPGEAPYVRTAAVGEAGTARFDGLPDGSWLAAAEVTWPARVPPSLDGKASAGLWVGCEVDLANDADVRVRLARRP